MIHIPNTELTFSFSRSSGAGGQNVNKVNTKVTLTWDYSSSDAISLAVKNRFEKRFSGFITKDKLVKIISQRYRNQLQNITDCTDKLHEMLRKVEKPAKKRIGTKPTRGSVEKRIKTKKGKSDVKKSRQKVKY